MYSPSRCETKPHEFPEKQTNEDAFFQNPWRRELKIDLLRILSGVQTRENTHAMLEYITGGPDIKRLMKLCNVA